MSDQLTRHFTWSELTATSVRSLAADNARLAMSCRPALLATAELLERVRELLGNIPLVVHSGFRCARLNHAIGGSSTSQHLTGQAADWHPVGVDLRVAFDAVRASGLEYGQLILEGGVGVPPSWLHLSLGAPWRKGPTRQSLVFDGHAYHVP